MSNVKNIVNEALELSHEEKIQLLEALVSDGSISVFATATWSGEGEYCECHSLFFDKAKADNIISENEKIRDEILRLEREYAHENYDSFHEYFNNDTKFREREDVKALSSRFRPGEHVIELNFAIAHDSH